MGKGNVAKTVVELLADYYRKNFIVNGTSIPIKNNSVNEMYNILLPFLTNHDKDYVTDRLMDVKDYWNQQMAGKKDLNFEDFVEGDLDITLIDSLYPDLVDDEYVLKKL